MWKLKWVLVGLVCLVSVNIAAAQDAAEAEVSSALLQQLAAIEDVVIEVRGLEPIAPVNRVFPSREDVSAFLNESIETQLTPELVEESLAFYYMFDFIDDPELDIVGLYLNLLEDQVGGYYDPEAETLNTILITGGELGDSLPLLEQIIYAHEFVHALQDQYYDLADLGFNPDNVDDIETDRFLAVQALVEGDATFVMNVYTEVILTDDPFAAVGLLGSAFTATGAIPEGTPDILTRELTFPYNAGLIFVTELINEGGYEAVDAAFADLPTSTEQIIDPQKYFEREDPIPVALDATDTALSEDWAVLDEGTLGAFYLRSYLNNHLERTEWAVAGDGWGGDRYQIFSNDGDYAMLMRLTWDTPQDSDEFDKIYRTYGARRFEVPVNTDGCWAAAGAAVCFRTLDGGDSVIARGPDVDVALALLATQS
jgi:hypothetical protein